MPPIPVKYHIMVMDVLFSLYDFVDARGKSVILNWVQDARLSGRDIGALNSKLDTLALNGPLLAPRILAGPIKKQRHIYKMVIHADRMLRPMLCKGPFEMNSEFTLLLGALEVGGRLTADPKDATAHREILLRDRNRRVPHARY